MGDLALTMPEDFHVWLLLANPERCAQPNMKQQTSLNLALLFRFFPTLVNGDVAVLFLYFNNKKLHSR